MKLRPTAETDAALQEHIETTHFFDENTGELSAPTEPPTVPGWGRDDDDEDDE